MTEIRAPGYWSEIRVPGYCETLPFEAPLAGPDDSLVYEEGRRDSGLRPGDRVVSINGQPVARMTWSQLRDAWARTQPEGAETVVRLGVARGGGVVPVETHLSRSNFVQGLESLRDSFQCHPSEEGPAFRVDAIRPTENRVVYRVNGQAWRTLTKRDSQAFAIDYRHHRPGIHRVLRSWSGVRFSGRVGTFVLLGRRFLENDILNLADFGFYAALGAEANFAGLHVAAHGVAGFLPLSSLIERPVSLLGASAEAGFRVGDNQYLGVVGNALRLSVGPDSQWLLGAGVVFHAHRSIFMQVLYLHGSSGGREHQGVVVVGTGL